MPWEVASSFLSNNLQAMKSFNMKISTSCPELSAQTQGGAVMAQEIFFFFIRGMRMFRPSETSGWILRRWTSLLIQLLKMEKFSDYQWVQLDPDLLLQTKGRTG